MPKAWHVQGHAWIIAADQHMVALDVAKVHPGKEYENTQLIWLTSAHPAHFDLDALAQLRRHTRIIVDPSFPRAEAEAVEMLNFAVHRIAEASLEVGNLKIIRSGDCFSADVGGQSVRIHRASPLRGPCASSSKGDVVPVMPGEPQPMTGQAVRAEEAPVLLQPREVPRPTFGPFPSDHGQRTAFYEAEQGLHRFGARLGCLLAAGHDERLAAAATEGLTIVIRDGPAERDFAFRFEAASYDFVPIPVPPKGKLTGNIMIIHLQDYWAMLKGDVLGWQLLENSLGSTAAPVTADGAGLAETWCVLHESRFEPDAARTYYQNQSTALMNEATLTLGKGQDS